MTHWRLDGHGVKGRAAFARERIGERWGQRRELAGGEGVEGAEAFGEFSIGQAALAIEPAEIIAGGAVAFAGIALQTAGNEVAVGIAAQKDTRHDMVDAPRRGRKPPPAIKTTAAFPRMDGLAQRRVLHEIHFIEVDGER